uniref:Small EDRK-rich factor-like N-terminal domain-containing protein n=1 Tax=Panthera leo TaxID=9689 RepID=A0A8C8YCX9_PANLE
MTHGAQSELAHQKNVRKQSDSVKGKRQHDGLSVATLKYSDSEIMWNCKPNDRKSETVCK